MKNLRFTTFIALLVIAVSPLLSQPPGGPGQGRRQMSEEDIKQRVERLAETLEMDDKQKEKIMKYEIDSYKKRQVEMQKFQGDREAFRGYMQTYREERDKVYKETLTEEQMKKYDELREQRRQEMQQRRQQQNPQQDGDRPDRGRGRG